MEVRGCAEVVQVVHDGRAVAEHPRASRERLLIDPGRFKGPGDDRVDPPMPLGRMGRRLEEIVRQKAGPPLEIDGILEKLLQLDPGHATEAMVAELTGAARHDRSAHQVPDRPLVLELDRREKRRVRTSMRLSGLPQGMTLGGSASRSSRRSSSGR